MSSAIAAAPCGRSLNPGEEAVLLFDTVYCPDCPQYRVALGESAERRFALRAGAVCGGGNPLD